MRLKQVFGFLTFSVLGLIFLLYFFTYSNQEKLIYRNAISSGIQDKLIILKEFDTASFNLTAYARYYATSGNKRFEAEYNNIVAWLNGNEPRRFDGLYPNESIPQIEVFRMVGFSEEAISLYQDAISASDRLVELETSSMILASSGEYEKASNILYSEEYKEEQLKIDNKVELLLKVVNENIKAQTRNIAQADDDIKKIDLLLKVVQVVVVLLVSLLLLVSYRLIIKSIGKEPVDVEKVVYKLAEGHLTQSFSETGKETGIYALIIKLNKKLSEVINMSFSVSDSVALASEELAAVMQNTAKNTQNELIQVEGISTAISELSSTSKEVSTNAVQAEDETKKAMENVNEGNKTLGKSIDLSKSINTSVQETASLIEDLKNSTLDIGEVTHVISSISEQINLLALNAAIEAARAGEYGRGFAVVADEVRVLASKTQESTKNIQEIISSLQEKSEDANSNMISNVTLIQESVALSELVKTSFDDISHSVQAISDINALVATASQEQYSVTEDIAKSATRAFDLVNENVAAVNQTQLAARELALLAEKQREELSFFKLG